MKQFLENLIKSIVEKPDAVSITEEQDQQGRQVLTISVDQEDMGRVIGKSGKVINSIRTIMRVVAIRQGVKVRVDIKDESSRSTDQTEGQDNSESETIQETESLVQQKEPQVPTPQDLVQPPERSTNTKPDNTQSEK